MIGKSGLKAGLIASLILSAFNAFSILFLVNQPLNIDALRPYATNLLIDVIIMPITGAILGLIFFFLEKPIILIDPQKKALVFGILVGVFLGINGREEFLSGTLMKNAALSILKIELIADLALGFFAGLLWGSIMGEVYRRLAYKEKKTVKDKIAEEAKGQIETLLEKAGLKKLEIPGMAKPIKCPRCGRENLPDAIYCRFCGEKLK